MKTKDGEIVKLEGKIRALQGTNNTPKLQQFEYDNVILKQELTKCQQSLQKLQQHHDDMSKDDKRIITINYLFKGRIQLDVNRIK